MRIGILTFHFAHNYGAVLQAYALCYSLRAIGHEARVIDYFPEDLRHLYTRNPFCVARKREFFDKMRRLPRNGRQTALFREFLKDTGLCTERRYRLEELEETNREFDFFITGSDQVWNDSIVKQPAPYFLIFAEEGKRRASYGASFGKNSISPETGNLIGGELERFEFISVRERAAAGILAQYTDKPVVQVPDPVFLLSEEQWRREAREYEPPPRYLLYYMLSDNEKSRQRSGQLGREWGLPVLIIHPACQAAGKIENGRQLYDVGPREFLYLTCHAEVVLTDSFHAASFGIIFRRTVIYLNSVERGLRVRELLEYLGRKTEQTEPVLKILPDSRLRENVWRAMREAREVLAACLRAGEETS